MQNADQYRLKINRSVYSLLLVLLIVLLLIFFLFQFYNHKTDKLDKQANGYHLAISKMSLQLLYEIGQIKLWFRDKELQDKGDALKIKEESSLIRIKLSKQDQFYSLKYEIEQRIKEISLAQSKYSLPEFKTVAFLLQKSRKKVLADLAALQREKNYSIIKIDMILSSIIPVVRQVHRLHFKAYSDIRYWINKNKTLNKIRFFSFLILLVVIGILLIKNLLKHVRGSLKDLTKAQDKIEKSQARFESMFRSIPDAVVYVDAERNIRQVNHAAINMFGYSEDELHGKPANIFYALENEFEQNGVKHLGFNSETQDEPDMVLYKQKNGTIFSGETLSTHVRASSGEFMGYLGIIRDVTERQLIEIELENYRDSLEAQVETRTAELIKARDQAEKASEAKSEFLSKMSHELRTPLNAILGFAQMLDLDSLNFSKVEKNNIHEILEAGHHLLALINEILDLARIESGRLNIDLEDVNLVLLLDECVKLMKPAIDDKNISFINNIVESEIMVQADLLRLKQIFINIISNAVKYNKTSGCLTIDVKVVKHQHVRISISDTGEGLTKEDVARLFYPFERLNVDHNIEGTGIGLTITKHLCELMGGKIGVDSVHGIGSTFWIELKLSNNKCGVL